MRQLRQANWIKLSCLWITLLLSGCQTRSLWSSAGTTRQFAAAVLAPSCGTASKTGPFYLDPVEGNDANTGLSAAAAFKTLEHARCVVASINANMTSDITVYLAGGTYELNSTLVFRPSDSGANGHNVIYAALDSSHPPVLSGGLPIPASSWVKLAPWSSAITAPNIYAYHVPPSQLSSVVPVGMAPGNYTNGLRQVYVNGTPAVRARIPKAIDITQPYKGGYYHLGNPSSSQLPSTNPQSADYFPASCGQAPSATWASFFNHQIPACIAGSPAQINAPATSTVSLPLNLSDIGSATSAGSIQYYLSAYRGSPSSTAAMEFFLKMQFEHEIYPVADLSLSGSSPSVSFPTTSDVIQTIFDTPEQYQYMQRLNNLSYHLENSPAFLTDPGEWYFDNAAKVLYYIPRSANAAEIATELASAVIPQLETLVQFSGQPGSPVQNIQFHGISFENTDWYKPGYTGLNTAQGVHFVGTNYYSQKQGRMISSGGTLYTPPGALSLSETAGIQFDSCTFQNLGAMGIDFQTANVNEAVTNSTFTQIAATAISIDDSMDTYYANPNLGQTQGILIARNTLNHFGLTYYSSLGMGIDAALQVVISHNDIGYGPNSGIQEGRSWDQNLHGYPTYDTFVNAGGQTVPCTTANCTYQGQMQVTDNGFHDLIQALTDTGAVYTLGNQSGPGGTGYTGICGNSFSNIEDSADINSTEAGRVLPGVPVYLDNGTSFVYLAQNAIDGVTDDPGSYPLNLDPTNCSIALSGTAGGVFDYFVTTGSTSDPCVASGFPSESRAPDAATSAARNGPFLLDPGHESSIYANAGPAGTSYTSCVFPSGASGGSSAATPANPGQIFRIFSAILFNGT